jgi:hypothetical protein
VIALLGPSIAGAMVLAASGEAVHLTGRRTSGWGDGLVAVVERDRLGAELHLSQRELGNMVGGSRESVNKHLQIWHRHGLIDLSNAAIMILDLEAIKRLM